MHIHKFFAGDILNKSRNICFAGIDYITLCAPYFTPAQNKHLNAASFDLMTLHHFTTCKANDMTA